MSRIMILISVVSTVLFALLVLIKIGVPAIVAILLALVAGYCWWRYEREDNENRGWADYLSSLMDVKDIIKYFNKLL